MSEPKVVIFANVMDERVRAARGIVHDSPAATRKVLAMAKAFAAAGVTASIVSMGRGRADGSGAWHPPLEATIAAVPIRYGPMLHRRGVSETLSALWLTRIALAQCAAPRRTLHLFYNQLSVWLPAMAILRVARRRTAVDIEDGPIDDAVVLHHVRGNASPARFARLVSDGALVACTALARGTTIRPTLPFYGAIGDAEPVPRVGPRSIVLTGTLAPETGAGLLPTRSACCARRGGAGG